MTALPRDNKRGNRFYFVVPTAHLIFVCDAGYAFMVERPEAFAEVVAGALQEVRRLNLKVEPECGFVREVINNRPEFNDLIGAREASRPSGGKQ
jgi:hypothetical protein